MPRTTIRAEDITDSQVGSAEIATDAVDSAEIAANAVTASEIAATTITPAQMAGSAFQAHRNMIVNGAMHIAQRGVTVAAVGAGFHTVDRWYTTKTNCGVWTQTQDSGTIGTTGFDENLKMDCTTADASLASTDRLMVSYRWEGRDCQLLKKGTAGAESVTISFWVNATKTGTYILELFDHDNARHICSAYTVSVTNTWEYKTVTFAGDTTGPMSGDNLKSLELQFYIAAGSAYTSGTLATSWAANVNANRAVGQVNAADSTSNNFQITGIQMEIGITATPFERKNYGQELQACLRYYQLKGMGLIGGIEAVSATVGVWRTGFTYDPPMRAAPTVGVLAGTITYNRPGVAAHASISNVISWNSNPTNRGTVLGVGNYNTSAGSGGQLGIISAGGEQFTFEAEL